MEERGKDKFVIKLKKMRTNLTIDYNDKIIIKLNENWWIHLEFLKKIK